MTFKKAALLLLALSLGTCNQAIMVAPPGSTMSCVPNPPFIAAHGDVSVISCLVIKATGQPTADGTVVQFFTTLGSIQEQGKTNDGVVRVNLVSDSRSGTASVTAVSGGGSLASPEPTPTPTPGGTSEGSPAAGLVSAMSVTGASAISAAQADGKATVIIGSARPTKVILSADPPRLGTGRSTTLLAQVFDENGNPAANVPVVFQIVSGTVQGRLDSGGRAVFTDNDGRATDVLRTNSTVAGSIVVRATAANGVASSDLTVQVFVS
jgi:hypothetical protein